MFLERAVEPPVPGEPFQIGFVIQNKKTIKLFLPDRIEDSLRNRQEKNDKEEDEEDMFEDVHWKCSTGQN
jgi:hypothetical protein